TVYDDRFSLPVTVTTTGADGKSQVTEHTLTGAGDIEGIEDAAGMAVKSTKVSVSEGPGRAATARSTGHFETSRLGETLSQRIEWDPSVPEEERAGEESRSQKTQ
ncbi:hypothetical protein, partial [Kitasatospora sp. MBT63]|uniref:hypothetical protein n=1 Tax=Kitasatospora sp. MBT63 TaxID=1444768 RepID=UPI001313FA03